ncbi:choice-of-anchor A family protein [Oerskovia turbata]|uniref:Choice-of-anchor A family protein n=1 Tax=Oerskovia turbata TaxID=1713 RepID=A0A4Q1KSJ8_9CELL|nr:choice-of-anchor A family protein [Oerskovia turbata]RXR22057.1 choice-of-anchor A family protein [Oerskovia turbata]RXR31984.1 choice-of-anchor A family protein [Oerskovia turbata]TGJ96903.1 choice-of-anchor A family protein [Actinotalea fermentans ATCC 43279 = JCM 9966 = DSM 3133]
MFLSSTRRTPQRTLLGALAAGALTTGLLGLGAAPALAVTPLPATALGSECPDFTGGLTNTPLFTDKGVAVFVGGDYTALGGAKESEGVLVSQGSVTIDTGDLMNLGVVGAGSQFTPPSGSDMVLAAGAVTVKSGRVEVAHRLEEGGNVVAGSTIDGTFELNGGKKTPHSPVPAPQAKALGTELGKVSADLASKRATGSLAGKVLTGDGTSAVQVFDVSAEQLASLRGEVTFENVGASAPIVVNVSGKTPSLSLNYIAAGSDRIDAGAALGKWAPRILWNFPDATKLTMTSSSQTVGSILAPRADVAQKTHTNGRLYVGGDLTFGGPGASAGLEHHNFPWIGSSTLGCDVPPTTVIPPITETPETPEPGEETPETPTTPVVPPTTTTPTPPTTPTVPADDDTPTADPEPAPSATDPAKADETPPGQEEGGLAATGAQTALIVVVAGALLAGGTWLVLLARRKRATS